MTNVKISRDISGRIVVTFSYDPARVAKVKRIEGHRWHPEEKRWSFPYSDDTLEKILKIFDGEKINIDSSLQNLTGRTQTRGMYIRNTSDMRKFCMV